MGPSGWEVEAAEVLAAVTRAARRYPWEAEAAEVLARVTLDAYRPAWEHEAETVSPG